jgi:hypothetical protein
MVVESVAVALELAVARRASSLVGNEQHGAALMPAALVPAHTHKFKQQQSM